MESSNSHEVAARFYKKEILKELPKSVIKRKPKRIVWFFVHALIITLLIYSTKAYTDIGISVTISLIFDLKFIFFSFGETSIRATILLSSSLGLSSNTAILFSSTFV